jgi:putative endonuclease
LTHFSGGDSLPCSTAFGGLAQLGERLAGSQKVRGSSPLSSIRLALSLPKGSLMAGHSTRASLGLPNQEIGESSVLSDRKGVEGLVLAMNRESVWWTYILECRDGSFYVGSSGDLAARLQVHQSGNGPAFTATRLPIRLVYSERHASLEAAVKRERQLKRWTHAKKAALVVGDAQRLRVLSRCRQSR